VKNAAVQRCKENRRHAAAPAQRANCTTNVAYLCVKRAGLLPGIETIKAGRHIRAQSRRNSSALCSDTCILSL
jgi:hypothetical protein